MRSFQRHPRVGQEVSPTAMTTRITPGLGANLIGQHAQERNQDATAYVGNLDPQVRRVAHVPSFFLATAQLQEREALLELMLLVCFLW